MLIRFLYRCRLCGETFYGSGSTNKEICKNAMLSLVYHAPWDSTMGVPPVLNEIHFCKDGGLGIADLLGMQQEKENE